MLLVAGGGGGGGGYCKTYSFATGLLFSFMLLVHSGSSNDLMMVVVIYLACHIPSLTFWHLPPNSAVTGYTPEAALLISTQLSIDTVSALIKVWVLIRLWKQHSVDSCT